MDILFTVYVGVKGGGFKDPIRTVMPGDLCWFGDAKKPYGPGTGEIWKSGRFGYFRVNGIPWALAKLMCSPARSVIVGLEGHRMIKAKWRYALSDVLYPALNTDYETPTLTLSLSDISIDKEQV